MGIYQQFSGTLPTTAGGGIVTYREIMLNQIGFNWEISQNWKAGQATAYDASRKTFVTFDNPASIANKAQFAKEKGLKGLMLWEIASDYKKDDADFNSKSLVKAMKSN